MKLSTRLSIAALATVAAAGGAGAYATAASAKTVTHHLGFTAVQQADVAYSQTSTLQEEKDVNHAGQVVGYDALRFYADPKTKTEKIDVSVTLKGGVLYGVLNAPDAPVIHGTVTGGTGIYKGAKGTVTAKPNSSNTKTAVTISYHS